jgi:predicted enzyme related to lactoylglutathione lyase
MTIQNALASVAVNDVDAAEQWYSRLLGTSGTKPMSEVAEWQFADGGGLQVYELPERAGHGSFTLAVDDIDVQADRLAELGITDAQAVGNEMVKTLMILDPDGNHIAFAQALDPSLAR